MDRAISIWKKIGKKSPDWELIIIGGSNSNSKYYEYIRNMAQGCSRLTFVGQCDPKPYYRTAKILMCTSNYEGWSMVLTEAMQHGVVPITFDSSEGFFDILDKGNCGLLVKSYDMKEYQAAVEFLMNNTRMLSIMAKKAYSHVKKYNIHNIVKSWHTLFRELETQ